MLHAVLLSSLVLARAAAPSPSPPPRDPGLPPAAEQASRPPKVDPRQ